MKPFIYEYDGLTRHRCFERWERTELWSEYIFIIAMISVIGCSVVAIVHLYLSSIVIDLFIAAMFALPIPSLFKKSKERIHRRYIDRVRDMNGEDGRRPQRHDVHIIEPGYLDELHALARQGVYITEDEL